MESSRAVVKDWNQRRYQLLMGYPLFVLLYWVVLVIIFLMLPALAGYLGSLYNPGIVLPMPILLIVVSANIVWAHDKLGTAGTSSNFSAKRVLKAMLIFGVLATAIAAMGFATLPFTPPSWYSFRLYILGLIAVASILIPSFLTSALMADDPTGFAKASIEPPLSWLVFPCVSIVYGILQLFGILFSITYPLLSVVWVLPMASLLPMVVMMFPYFAVLSKQYGR
ncbi:MAG: hypothetical protein GF309_03495 [Candidatus Lokiarchaeota archaeon]|nr:hypothetical protein [Candidatus Lokiarchaeota archaeon]